MLIREVNSVKAECKGKRYCADFTLKYIHKMPPFFRLVRNSPHFTFSENETLTRYISRLFGVFVFLLSFPSFTSYFLFTFQQRNPIRVLRRRRALCACVIPLHGGSTSSTHGLSPLAAGDAFLPHQYRSDSGKLQNY